MQRITIPILGMHVSPKGSWIFLEHKNLSKKGFFCWDKSSIYVKYDAQIEAMFKYNAQKFTNIEEHSDHFKITDLYQYKDVIVAINNSELALECQTCFSNKEFNCEHVYTIWQNPEYAEELSRRRFPKPIGWSHGQKRMLVKYEEIVFEAFSFVEKNESNSSHNRSNTRTNSK